MPTRTPLVFELNQYKKRVKKLLQLDYKLLLLAYNEAGNAEIIKV